MRLLVVSEEKLTNLVKLTGGVALFVAMALLIQSGVPLEETPSLTAATGNFGGSTLTLNATETTVAPGGSTNLSWTVSFSGSVPNSCFSNGTTCDSMLQGSFNNSDVRHSTGSFVAPDGETYLIVGYANSVRMHKWTPYSPTNYCPIGGGFGNGVACATSSSATAPLNIFQTFSSGSMDTIHVFSFGADMYLALARYGGGDVVQIYKWHSSGCTSTSGAGWGGPSTCNTTPVEDVTLSPVSSMASFVSGGNTYVTLVAGLNLVVFRWMPPGTPASNTTGCFGNGTACTNAAGSTNQIDQVPMNAFVDETFTDTDGTIYLVASNRDGIADPVRLWRWRPTGGVGGLGCFGNNSVCDTVLQNIPVSPATAARHISLFATSTDRYLGVGGSTYSGAYTNYLYKWRPAQTCFGNTTQCATSTSHALQSFSIPSSSKSRLGPHFFVAGQDVYMGMGNTTGGGATLIHQVYKWTPSGSGCPTGGGFGNGTSCGASNVWDTIPIPYQPSPLTSLGSVRSVIKDNVPYLFFGTSLTGASNPSLMAYKGPISCAVTWQNSLGSGTVGVGNSGSQGTGPLTETTTYTLNCPGIGSIEEVVTIASPKPVATIVATDAVATENPVTTGTFTVSFDTASTSNTTVFYNVTGLASPGNDYTALSGSVVVPANQTSATIVVTPLNDLVYEGSETVIVTLSSNGNYDLGAPSSATVTITDDETDATLPTLSLNSLTTTPSLVRKGQTTIVAWDVSGLVTGANGNSGNSCIIISNPTLSGFPVSWPGVGSTWVGSASPTINVRTTFTLTCFAPNGTTLTSVSKTVGIVPTYQEI